MGICGSVSTDSQRIAQVVLPKGGGQPTINESDPLGYGPGLIIAVPGKTTRSAKTALPFDDQCGGECSAPTFIVAYDKGTAAPGYNASFVVVPIIPSCADLSSEFSVIERLDGTANVTITVTNDGPNTANGVVAHFQMNAPPGTLSLKKNDTEPPFFETPPDQTTLNATGDGVDFSAASLPCGAQLYQEMEITGGMAPSDNAIGIVTAYSATPDPAPNNNAYEESWTFGNAERHVLNAPAPSVVIGVVHRGK